MPQVASAKGVPVSTLAAGSTTGTGTPVNIPVTSKDCNFYIKGTGTISAGTLLLEESDDPTYTGVWSLILSVDLTTITAGASKVVHVTGQLRAVRARISVNVTGGGSIAVDVVSS